MIVLVAWAQHRSSSAPHDVGWGCSPLGVRTSKVTHSHGGSREWSRAVNWRDDMWPSSAAWASQGVVAGFQRVPREKCPKRKEAESAGPGTGHFLKAAMGPAKTQGEKTQALILDGAEEGMYRKRQNCLGLSLELRYHTRPSIHGKGPWRG